MTRRGAVLFAVMSVIWGVPYLFIKVAVAEVSPTTLVFCRTAPAALILLPIAVLRGELRPALRRWPWLAAFAVIEVALPWVALGSAEQWISSSLAGLLVAGVSLVGAVIGRLTGGRERMTARSGIGLLAGLLGVVAIVGLDTSSANVLALALMAVVVLGYALGPLILARRLGGLSPVAVMAISLSLCAAGYTPVALLQWPHQMPGTPALVSAAVLAVLCTAAAFLIFAALIGEVGPVRATVITYVNPAVAALLGVLVLHEQFTPGMGLGFALVVAGSVLATRQTAPVRDVSAQKTALMWRVRERLPQLAAFTLSAAGRFSVFGDIKGYRELPMLQTALELHHKGLQSTGISPTWPSALLQCYSSLPEVSRSRRSRCAPGGERQSGRRVQSLTGDPAQGSGSLTKQSGDARTQGSRLRSTQPAAVADPALLPSASGPLRPHARLSF